MEKKKKKNKEKKKKKREVEGKAHHHKIPSAFYATESHAFRDILGRLSPVTPNKAPPRSPNYEERAVACLAAMGMAAKPWCDSSCFRFRNNRFSDFHDLALTQLDHHSQP